MLLRQPGETSELPAAAIATAALQPSGLAAALCPSWAPCGSLPILGCPGAALCPSRAPCSSLSAHPGLPAALSLPIPAPCGSLPIPGCPGAAPGARARGWQDDVSCSGRRAQGHSWVCREGRQSRGSACARGQQQLSPMSRGGEMVYIPDDSDFSSFRDQCESLEGWHCRYNKAGVTVWSQGQEESCTVQKIKTRISCKDVPAETLYDVLHDTSYRKKWDSNMIETYDIGRLTVNADVGYYSWKCPSPLKNRDFVTLRSWLPLGNDYMIINYSVKHPKYPPRKDFVRAVSLQTGYLIKANGDGACILYYLTQVDPRGSLPKWVVNRVSQFVAPKAMKKIYKAGLKYPEWKRRHDPEYKPWVFPEQNTLPSVSLAELSVQHADSLENIDETGLPEEHLSTSDHEA